MSFSFSRYAKRILLVAGIGLFISPAVVLADEPKLEVKPFNIKINGPGNNEEEEVIKIRKAPKDRLIFVQEGSGEKKVIPLPPAAGGVAVPAMGPHLHLMNEHIYTSSPYQIGAELRGLNNTMRWMMKLPEDQGVALFKIMPDSPAAKAGLQERDIIIKIDDQVVESPKDIILSLTKSEGKEVKIVYLRDNKESTVSLKPDKKPDSAKGDEKGDKPTYSGRTVVSGNDVSGGTLVFKGPGLEDVMTFVQPGVAMPAGAGTVNVQHAVVQIPKDMKITVTRNGNKPEVINIKWDNKTWDNLDSPEKIAKLPESVRGPLMAFLGNMPTLAGGGNHFFITGNIAGVPGAINLPKAMPLSPGVKPGQFFEKRIIIKDGKQIVEESSSEGNTKQLEKQLHEMQKQIEEIRKQLPKKE